MVNLGYGDFHTKNSSRDQDVIERSSTWDLGDAGRDQLQVFPRCYGWPQRVTVRRGPVQAGTVFTGELPAVAAERALLDENLPPQH